MVVKMLFLMSMTKSVMNGRGSVYKDKYVEDYIKSPFQSCFSFFPMCYYYGVTMVVGHTVQT